MKHVLLMLAVASLALAGCTSPDESSRGDEGAGDANGDASGGGSSVGGQVTVRDAPSPAEGNNTTSQGNNTG